jgi:hypothetical protein
MRNPLLGAAAPLAGGAAQAAPPSAPPLAAAGPPDTIEVVFNPGSMFFSVEDGGVGRFRTDARADYTFPVSHEDYLRIRELMEPYRAEGLLCDDPDYTPDEGYLAWRENGVETRRPHESLCYTDANRAAGRSLDRAYYAVEEMGKTRHVAPPGLPDPDRITLTSLYWGRTTENWIIPRGGEARYEAEGSEPRAFAVSAADFDRLRDLFRPYEGVRFECRRVIADGPYGHVTWSQDGHEDQRLEWDAGCVTGDAADVFRRWDEAEVLLEALRDGA